MSHWVQLKISKLVEVRGVPIQKYPGDWVEVGRQTAIEWIAQEIAWSFRLSQIMPSGCGIAARGGIPRNGNDYLGLPVSNRTDRLPYPRTLLWDAPKLNLRTNILPIGFKLLDSWQVVAPLFDYDMLACHVGSEEDRERTKAIIRDLRVPTYDTRMIFMRRSKDTQRLLALWRQEEHGGSDPKLAFLRAVYRIKPVICAQPTSWTRKT